MTGVSGADRILDGTPIVDGTTPDRCNSSLWDVKPMDYVLYCVKYINQWHAYYLRRGVDQITENGVTTTEVRHNKYVEDDEVMMLTTNTLKSVLLPVSTRVRNEATGSTETLTCDLILTFNDNNECVITSSSEYPASGSGKFVSKGEKKSWGNKDRDVIYLDYQIDFSGKKYVTKDTLVVRNRGVSVEEFTPSYVE